jgi:hypothetical protein
LSGLADPWTYVGLAVAVATAAFALWIYYRCGGTGSED